MLESYEGARQLTCTLSVAIRCGVSRLEPSLADTLLIGAEASQVMSCIPLRSHCRTFWNCMRRVCCVPTARRARRARTSSSWVREVVFLGWSQDWREPELYVGRRLLCCISGTDGQTCSQSVITDFPDPALVKNLEKNVALLGGTEGKTEALVSILELLLSIGTDSRILCRASHGVLPSIPSSPA